MGVSLSLVRKSCTRRLCAESARAQSPGAPTMELETSPEIERLLTKLANAKSSCAEMKERVDTVAETLKQLDQEYGTEIERAKSELARAKERFAEENARFTMLSKKNMLKEVLPIADSYTRVRKMLGPLSSTEEERIDQSYNNIFNDYNGIMEGLGVERVECLGKPFDPMFMEAISADPSKEYPKDVVSTQFHAGYRMGDICVKPAMVVVSTGPGPNATDASP